MKVLIALFGLILSCNGMSAHVNSSTPIVHLVEERPEVVEMIHSARGQDHLPLHHIFDDELRFTDDYFRLSAPAFYRLRWNRPLESPRGVNIIEIGFQPSGRTGWKEYKRERLILCDTGTIESHTIPFSRRLSGSDGSVRTGSDDSVLMVRIMPATDTTHLWNHGEAWDYEIGTPAQLVFGELPQTAIEQPWLQSDD